MNANREAVEPENNNRPHTWHTAKQAIVPESAGSDRIAANQARVLLLLRGHLRDSAGPGL